MASANTVAMAPRLPGNAVGASSTSELDMLNSAGAVATFCLPGSARLAGKSWLFRAVGRATGGTTTNLTVKIYVGSVAIVTSGAIAINSVSGNFCLEALVVFDATSAKGQGILYGYLNATAVAQAALTAGLSSLDLNTEGANVVKATAQFSASDANNAAVLTELALDAV